MAAVFAFIAGYDPYMLRLGRQRRCRWEPAAWIEERLQQCGEEASHVQAPWARDRRCDRTAMASVKLRGVLKVEAGDCWKDSGLQAWGIEAESLHRPSSCTGRETIL